MRRIVLLTLLILSIYTSKSQNMSFTCPRDSILGCNAACLTIKGQFPDIRGLGNDYTLKNVSSGSACRPYVDPGGPGPSANLVIDDRYSQVLPLPFNFLFYGVSYNSIIVSTNGFVSFDVSEANSFSHYGILNSGGFLSASAGAPQNLPSTLYDRAIIMGPYHDLDPSVTQPTQKIKHEEYGNAPNRKWILSFYKTPLFLTECNALIENTHQIILHESTGIVEVFIKDKQICTGWNEGRSMVGLQDFTKAKGIMAPGRAATDAPWGSIGMNETWRFIPTGGAPLYRRVELLDATGAVVATGDTTRIDANTFETSFPNVCPPPGNSLYVIKTTYQKIDDPAPGAVIYSLDTINIIKQAALPVTATMTPTTCGSNTGTITVTVAGGSGPYSYSLDGGPSQTSNVFTNVSAGPHTVFAQDAGGCNNTVTITVTAISSIPSTVVVTNTSCPGVNNGTITVTPTAGTAPFTFSLNGGPVQPTGVFGPLSAGAYTIAYTDFNGCTGDTTATVVGGPSITVSLSTTATSCPGVNNGTVTITPISGTAPYSYTMDGGTPQTSNVFTNLAPGTHSLSIVDANGCTGTRSPFISTGAGLTATSITVATSCPGVDNGSITINPTNGTAPYTYSLDGGPTQAGNIFTGVAAGTHTVAIRDINGCTGNRTVTVTTGLGITGSATSTATSCPGVNNGTVTVTPTSGTAPYTYSIDAGVFQASNIFTGVADGPHTITFRDINGCTGTTNITVAPGTGLTGTTTIVNTSCPTVNNGSVTITPTSGATPYQYSIDGGVTFQASNIFPGLAPGTYTITISDVIGCTGTVSATISSGTNITSVLNTTNPPCANITNGLIVVNPTSGTAAYQYSLNGGPFQASNTFTGLPAGNYTIDITDQIGCTGTNSTTLTTNTPINTTVSMTMPLCNGNANGSITLTPSGGVSPYEFSINAGTVYQPGGTFSNLAAGTHTIRIKDFAGCTKDTTVILSEPALLTASAVNSAPASCSGNNGTITVTGNGGTGAYQYSINGVNFQPGNVFTAPAVGPYPNIQVKDANGCIAITSAVVSLVDAMFLTLGPDTTICVGASVRMLPQTSAGTSVYNWRPLNTTLTNPNTIDTTTIRNATVTPVDTATYILNAMWGACVREDTITVNILHKPVAHAGQDTAICDLSSAILRGSASNLSGTVNYVWSPASLVDDDSAAVTIATPPVTQIYTLTVTDNYGCNFSVTDEVLVTVQPPVPAYAGNDTIAVLGQPHQLSSSGGVSYLWSPSFPLNISTAQNPLATLTNDQLFVVKVTDIAGCIGYDSVFVQVYNGPNYYVPNAFSPNGDGLNDIFRAIPVGIVSTDWFRVFNRFGQLVFETNQWLKGWDGKFKGKTQPVGTYVWVIKGIDKNGKVIEMKGTVTLIQ